MVSGHDLAELRRLVAACFPEGAHLGAWEVTVEGRSYGLVNLFQAAARIPESDWPAFVRWHFEMIRGVRIELPAEYEKAAPRLRVRISRAGNFHSPARQLCEGLTAVLMLRIPAGSHSFPPSVWDSWGVEPERVWDEALRVTLLDEPSRRRELRAGVRCVDGGFYASTNLLDPSLSLMHSLGVLAMVPRNDSLLYIPVDSDIVASCASLIELGQEMFAAGPHSISPDLFWVHRGIFRPVIRQVDGSYRGVWGADFSEVLGSLSVL